VPVSFAVAVLIAGGAGARADEVPAAVPIAFAAASPAPTQAASPEASTPVPVPPAAAPPAPQRTSLGRDLDVRVHGQFFMGAAADERDGWTRQLGLDQARIEVEARFGAARTVIEADLASNEPIKDAYLRLDGPFATRLTAGRFKAPFSARQLTSSWRLPLVDRGLVDSYVVDRNAIGGRRLGATGAVRPFDGRAEIEAGVFSSDPSDSTGGAADDVAARASIRPWKAIEIGTSAYRASAAGGARRQAGAAHLRLAGWGVEAELEGMAGRLVEGPFVAATALAMVTVKLLEGRLRVAPVAAAELLELREGARARGEGVIGGAVISWLDGLKLKLQWERARRPGDEGPRNAVAVELATRF